MACFGAYVSFGLLALLHIANIGCTLLTTELPASGVTQEAICPANTHPENGVLLLTNGTGGVGTIAVFKCDSGYYIMGHHGLRCMDNLTWSSPQPYCTSNSSALMESLITHLHVFYEHDEWDGVYIHNGQEKKLVFIVVFTDNHLYGQMGAEIHFEDMQFTFNISGFLDHSHHLVLKADQPITDPDMSMFGQDVWAMDGHVTLVDHKILFGGIMTGDNFGTFEMWPEHLGPPNTHSVPTAAIAVVMAMLLVMLLVLVAFILWRRSNQRANAAMVATAAAANAATHTNGASAGDTRFENPMYDTMADSNPSV